MDVCGCINGLDSVASVVFMSRIASTLGLGKAQVILTRGVGPINSYTSRTDPVQKWPEAGVNSGLGRATRLNKNIEKVRGLVSVRHNLFGRDKWLSVSWVFFG